MIKKVAVVNKCYWPDGTLIGGALLEVTKQLLNTYEVVVIAQSKHRLDDLCSNLRSQGEYSLKFDLCEPKSNRQSSLAKRGYDAFYFMFHVFFGLIRHRPNCVYVSTNPPIFVPFMVFLYCKLFSAKYIYHVQDIHPEAARLITPMNGLIYVFLRFIDTISLRHSATIITLTKHMEKTLFDRGGLVAPMKLLNNPANASSLKGDHRKIQGQLIYTGSLGRFQNVGLLVDGIAAYLEANGKLSFLFCGDGFFAPKLQELSQRYEKVEYLGLLNTEEAANLVAKHEWALLPIDDRVTKYAFPCKTSTYLAAGCKIFAISSNGNAISDWVAENDAGFSVEPNVISIVNGLKKLEHMSNLAKLNGKESCKLDYSMTFFAKEIVNLVKKVI